MHSMWLKVGELARRSGLTVRALHHYDQIGLLTPSVRTDAGYRLYDRDDVARLHAIQSLHALGVPLKQIGGMLAGDGSDLSDIVARQMRSLDRQIEQASALRQRLALLGEMLAAGHQPEVEDWLGTLGLMHTYAQYFSTAEIRRIVSHWPQVAERWTALVQQLRAAMERGTPPGDPQVQTLAQQWMGLMHHWFGGDFDLMRRWGAVYATEPAARGRRDPGPQLVRYVEQATEPRMALWLKHFSIEELSGFKPLAEADSAALRRDVLLALQQGIAPQSASGQRLLKRWHRKLTIAVGGDPQRTLRLQNAYAHEPALRLTSTLPPQALAFLLTAAEA